ncbi:MAG: fused MFS/spermidine synthase [Deferrisomatales bacterium]|nr:fused MFS/spermidine synthase [Deferrisomatales bacterium]
MKQRVWFVYFLSLLSGVAGLGYEMVWSRSLGLVLGHEFPAVLAVLGAFFAGMALGAWSLGSQVRLSPRPDRWYVGLELAIGVWALVLAAALPALGHWIGLAIGPAPGPVRHWAVAFGGTLLALAPATIAMGATLPAMERMLVRACGRRRWVGGLYGANTFGAVVGVLATPFLLVPALGHAATMVLLASVNFLCATVAGWRLRPAAEPPTDVPSTTDSPSRSQALVPVLLGTGFLGLSYEVLVVRVASQMLENTVYTFACLLAVYLLGTSIGAAFYQRWARSDSLQPRLQHLLTATGGACAAGVALLLAGPAVAAGLQKALGGGMAAALAGEGAVAALAFFVPTIAMGATFSHLAQAASGARLGLGRAIAVNTLGASAAPLAAGLWVLPAIGAKAALLATSLAYLFLARPGGRAGWAGAGAVAAGVLALLLHPASPGAPDQLDGDRMLSHQQGVMGSVSVVEDSRGERHLMVNNRFQMGGTTSAYSDRREAHIPLLLHPAPRRALFLGLGTGATLSAAGSHPGLVAEGVELVPEVVAAMPYFARVNGAVGSTDRLRIHVGDARRFVRSTPHRYDVVVADLFHPARDGAGSLYTVEHFRAVDAVLEPGGLFCQWLPLYQMDLETLRLIIRSFLQVYPGATAHLAHYSLQAPILGLIGGAEQRRYSLEWVRQRIRDPALRTELGRLRLAGDLELLGSLLAGPSALAEFAGPGPLNTDDRPLVTFRAPRFTYSPQATPTTRLLELIDNLSATPGEVLTAAALGDPEQASRVQRHWAARDQYLRLGTRIQPTRDAEQLLARAGGPLLEVVRSSPDFDAAYYPLLAMARQLYDQNPEDSRRILLELERACPQRGEATQVLRSLFPL